MICTPCAASGRVAWRAPRPGTVAGVAVARVAANVGLNAPRHGLWMALDAVVVHGALPRAAAASATVARSVPSANHVRALSRSPCVPPWHRGFVHKARAYLGASGRCLPLSPAPSCPGYPRSSPSAPAGAVAGDLCSTQCATVQLGDASGTLMLGKLVRPPQRWRCMALRRRRLVRSGTVACAYCPTVIIAAAMVAAVRQPLVCATAVQDEPALNITWHWRSTRPRGSSVGRPAGK